MSVHEICTRKSCQSLVSIFDASYHGGDPYHTWCLPNRKDDFVDPFIDPEGEIDAETRASIFEEMRKEAIEELVDPDEITVCDECGCGLGHRRDCPTLPIPRSRALVLYDDDSTNPNSPANRIDRGIDKLWADMNVFCRTQEERELQ